MGRQIIGPPATFLAEKAWNKEDGQSPCSFVKESNNNDCTVAWRQYCVQLVMVIVHSGRKPGWESWPRNKLQTPADYFEKKEQDYITLSDLRERLNKVIFIGPYFWGGGCCFNSFHFSKQYRHAQTSPKLSLLAWYGIPKLRLSTFAWPRPKLICAPCWIIRCGHPWSYFSSAHSLTIQVFGAQ